MYTVINFLIFSATSKHTPLYHPSPTHLYDYHELDQRMKENKHRDLIFFPYCAISFCVYCFFALFNLEMFKFLDDRKEMGKALIRL